MTTFSRVDAAAFDRGTRQSWWADAPRDGFTHLAARTVKPPQSLWIWRALVAADQEQIQRWRYESGLPADTTTR